MATWLSKHGIGAIKDSSSTFAINMSGGSTILTGWLHFAIPSSPVEYPNLKDLSIKFFPHSVAAESVLVFLANHKVVEEGSLQQTASFNLDIASTKATCKGDGIAISIKLVFSSVASTLTFQSELRSKFEFPTR
ncbi:hypothetical protein BTUL_0247g00160 [Botrytis tulipae]|uniref:Uncharacterized protein n=1 Tax=Botrytis tulipae TaxID=87230 RepID=A0A4Z1EER5_9HELO|nr:hypothetical protein BTUL_0247g00160 [Botrytis tulipae]